MRRLDDIADAKLVGGQLGGCVERFDKSDVEITRIAQHDPVAGSLRALTSPTRANADAGWVPSEIVVTAEAGERRRAA